MFEIIDVLIIFILFWKLFNRYTISADNKPGDYGGNKVNMGVVEKNTDPTMVPEEDFVPRHGLHGEDDFMEYDWIYYNMLYPDQDP